VSVSTISDVKAMAGLQIQNPFKRMKREKRCVKSSIFPIQLSSER